jgi:hypothetical protein
MLPIGQLNRNVLTIQVSKVWYCCTPRIARSVEVNRIAVLQKQIKWIKQHYHGLYTLRRHRGIGNIGNNINKDDNVKQLKAELADLLEEDAKADKLRRLPLYSCGITEFKFVCSKCYDKVYNNHMLLQRP